MPIRKELRKFYGRAWLTITRPRILARAGNCCEHCGKPNSQHVYTRTWSTFTEHRMEWQPTIAVNIGTWCVHSRPRTPRPVVHSLQAIERMAARSVRVVLTVAHLNHTPGDDRDDNLAALCQWCHLILDIEHHHKTRAERKDAARPMLVDSQHAV
jgi:hypothetical protein